MTKKNERKNERKTIKNEGTKEERLCEVCNKYMPNNREYFNDDLVYYCLDCFYYNKAFKDKILNEEFKKFMQELFDNNQ